MTSSSVAAKYQTIKIIPSRLHGPGHDSFAVVVRKVTKTGKFTFHNRWPRSQFGEEHTYRTGFYFDTAEEAELAGVAAQRQHERDEMRGEFDV